jgi:hypothetical protein
MTGNRIIEWALASPGFGLVLVLLPLLASAADGASPEARWNAVVACAGRSDERERHACVDEVLRRAGVLTAAQDERDERQRFGRKAAPPAEAETEAVNVRIQAASEGRDGRWSFTTEDGAVWRQTEDRNFAVTPQAGHTLTINKGMLGSFLCEVNGKSPFRCARSR